MRDSDSPPSGGSPSSVGRARLGQTRTGGGTSAAGSSGFLGRGCSTYSTPGVFVPGYTHLNLPGPAIRVFLARLSSPRSLLCASTPLSFSVSLYISLSLYSLFFHCLPFNIVPTINPLQLRDEFFKSDRQICECRPTEFLDSENRRDLVKKPENGSEFSLCCCCFHSLS